MHQAMSAKKTERIVFYQSELVLRSTSQVTTSLFTLYNSSAVLCESVGSVLLSQTSSSQYFQRCQLRNRYCLKFCQVQDALDCSDCELFKAMEINFNFLGVNSIRSEVLLEALRRPLCLQKSFQSSRLKKLEGFRLKSTFKEIIFCRDSIETFEPSSSLFLKIQVIVEFFGIFREKKEI